MTNKKKADTDHIFSNTTLCPQSEQDLVQLSADES